MQPHTKFWRLLPILLCTLAVGGLLWGAQPVFAESAPCIQDNWAAAGNTQGLQCTANDVSIAQVTDICVGSCCQSNNCKPSCVSPGTVTFTADFEVLLTAQTRYDIGLYIGSANSTVNGGGVLTGTCNDFIITPGEENGTIFTNLDASPDVCGEIINNTKDTTLNNPQLLHLTVTTACVGDANGNLKLPNCTSWRTSGQNDICTKVTDAYPGSPSKCNCQPGFTIPIQVQKPSISLTKKASPTQVPEGPTGGEVTYTVDVKNNSTCTPQPCTPISETVGSLTDNKYGDITKDKNSVPTPNPLINSTTCSVPQDIAGGATYECTFKATVSGLDSGQSFSDTVCTDHVTDTNGNPVSDACGSASVSATDVKPTAAVVKNATTCAVICAEITYTVQVDNTDTAETLVLTALTDDKVGGNGDITTIHDNVLGTTCGVDTSANGLGDLSGVLGSGTLGGAQATIAIGGNYTCKFNAKVCAPFPYKNTVTATLHDDENNQITPSGSKTISNAPSCTLQ